MQPDGDTTVGKTAQEPRASVLRSAAFMSLGTLISRVLGLIRDTVLLALFPRMISDAYVVAFRLPNLFRRVLGEGSLAASFVPLYVEAIQIKPGEFQEDANKRAQSLASAIYSLLTMTTASLSVLGIIFMEPIMNMMVGGEGYQSIEGKVDLTIMMARIMFSFLFLVMTYAFLMSVLNAHKKFFLPAFAPAALNFSLIVFSFLPAFRFDGDQLAWGVLVGGILQLALVVWPLVKMNQMPKFTTKIMVPGVVVFFRNLIPNMLGMSILQVLAILNVYFASRLEQGSHSYIYAADRLLELPQSLMSVSLGVALLPTLSELWAKNKKSQLIDTVQRHVRLLLSLSLPAGMGLYILSDEIVDVVFRRGEFSMADAAMTASVVKIYAIVLVVAGLHRVTVPAFYAIKNTWLPALISAVCVGIHFFVASWAVDHYQLKGLVAATAFTGFLNLAFLAICFRIYFGSLGIAKLLKCTVHMVPALLAMAVPVYYFADPILLSLGRYAGLVALILAAIAMFFLVGRLTKHPEIAEIMGLLGRRFRKPQTYN